MVKNKLFRILKPKGVRGFITLDDETLSVLKVWKRQQNKRIFPKLVKAYQHDSNYIFTNNSGGWLLAATMKVKLSRFFRKHNKLKKFRLTDLGIHMLLSFLKLVLQQKLFQIDSVTIMFKSPLICIPTSMIINVLKSLTSSWISSAPAKSKVVFNLVFTFA